MYDNSHVYDTGAGAAPEGSVFFFFLFLFFEQGRMLHLKHDIGASDLLNVVLSRAVVSSKV